MRCYRDRTFCTADDCTHWKFCTRALTDEVKAKAELVRMPIFSTKRMECYEVKK